MKTTNYRPNPGAIIVGGIVSGTGAHSTGLISVGDGTTSVTPSASLLFTGGDVADLGNGAASVAIAAVDKRVTNKTGGALAYGDIVIIDTTNDSAVTKTATPRIETTIGAAIESIPTNSTGLVRFVGFINSVTVGISALRGHYMETNSVALQATGNSTRRSGSFGQFLTSGLHPKAWMWGAADQTAGAGSSPLTTKGDVWGYSTVDARIPVGTDGQVLTADSTQALGVKWGTSAGGGNVSTAAATTIDYGRANLYAYGSLVSATYGDNFDTGSLDAKWNAYYGARGNWNTTDMLGWAHDSGAAGALIQAVPAGNWTIECEVIPGTLAATGFQDEGLIVTSGSSQGSSTDMRWGIGQNNSFTSYRLVWEKFVNGAFSSSYTTNLNALTIPMFAPIYLRLVWGGTNMTAQWSYNRKAWYDIAAAAAPGFTIANFGINNNSSNGWFNYFDKVA